MLTWYRTAEYYGQLGREMAERLNSDWLQGCYYELHSQLALFQGKWNEALKAAHQGIDLLKKGGDYFEITWTYMMANQALFYLGRLEEAKKQCEGVMEICQRTQVKGYCYFLAQHALFTSHLGNPKLGVEEAKQAFQIAQKDSSDAFSLGFTEMILGECLLNHDDIDTAIFYLENVKQMRENKKLLQDWFVAVYPLLARAYLHQYFQNNQSFDRKEWTNIKKLIRKGRKLSRRHPNFVVPTLITQAMYSWATDDKSSARHEFAEAIKKAEKQEGMFYLAQARFEAARLGEKI